MTNKEKIVLLNQYKNYLLSLKEYQEKIENEKQIQEKENELDKPKVLVLKRNFYGKNLKVS